MSWFALVKWLHIMAAIVAVGANLTYGVWIRRAAREPAVLPFVLRNIASVDRSIANPCYVVLLVTGVIMALTLRLPLSTPWILTSLVLYSAAALLGLLAYAPLSRQQRALLETEGFSSAKYQAIAGRTAVLGVIVTADVVAIIFLMVVKPALWP